MKTLVLRVTNEGFHYADNGLIPGSATNLPFADMTFGEREAIYWEVNMLSYQADTARLQVQCVDYEARADSFAPSRQMRKPVRELHFEPLDGEMLRSQLTYYRAGALRACTLTAPPSPALHPAAAPESDSPEKAVAELKFNINILDLTFANGGVKGLADPPGVAEPLPFRILNDHIVAEFDHIKPFFVRALKRKTVRVKAQLRFENDEPKIVSATSADIARINDDMLTLFRARAVRQLLRPDHLTTVDKSLFTPDEVFASLDDDELGKATLPHDGHDLLAEILRHKDVRNARQLQFLAGTLQREDAPLRYVLSPTFGFVFLTSGQDANHFILELLDSHATYVWSIPQGWETLDAQFRAVEREIAAINTLGRGQYRRTLHFEHEFWFVVHENAESGLVDGFPRWRNRLLEGLV